jgi:hypothetical protein
VSGGAGGGGPQRSSTSADELLKLLPSLAKDDTDGSLRRMAARAMFHSLRASESQASDQGRGAAGEGGGAEAPRLASQIIRTVALSPSQKVRSVCPDVAMALLLLGRTQPLQAVSAVSLLRTLLSKETSPSTLLALYYNVVESVAVIHGTPCDGDLISAVHGTMHIHLGAVDQLGAPILWSLYWGLRASQLGAAQRARYTIASILSGLHLQAASNHLIALWTKVMGDPFPPCAVIGAQKIIRISGLSAYDKYEAAVSEAQQHARSSTYTMALSIWQRVEADMKQKASQ